MRCSPSVQRERKSARTPSTFGSADSSGCPLFWQLKVKWSFKLLVILLHSSSTFFGSFNPCRSVIIVRADKLAKAGISRLRLFKFKEKSLIESSHSPNPRRHWSLWSTSPLQNTNLSSAVSDLMESLSTNSSKKADSMSNVWSSFGRSVNPGIFSAQPLDMSMEAVRRL